MKLRSTLEHILNPRGRYLGLTNSPDPDRPPDEEILPRRRVYRKQLLSNFPLIIGTLIVSGLFMITLLGPSLAPQNPYLTSRHIVTHFDPKVGKLIDPPLPPSAEFPLGTDRWGTDNLSLLLHGARNTLVACTFITMIRVLLGLLMGGIAGWNEGQAPDQFVMGTIGVITAVPILISSIFLIYALDIRRGLLVFIIALSLVGWTEIAQYARSEFMVLKKMPYIEGARALGLEGIPTAIRHVLPNILPALLVIAFLEMGAVMMLLGELGFIGVYIGGGSRISVEVALEVQEVFQLIEVPEWGAMLAEGFHHLRSKPFVIFPPALAFFIAVVGFNTLGEGLRRQIETQGFNTAFLLRKRMLFVILIITAATAYIIQQTGPTPWFTKMAQSFDGNRARNEATTLASMSGRGHGQAGGFEATDYISGKFEEYGLQPGWQHNGYIHSTDSQLIRALEQPVLAVVSQDGDVLRTFIYQEDYAYSLAGHGGSGQAEGEVAFVGFYGVETPSFEDYRGMDLSGKVIMLQEGNAPANFPTEALIRGAVGIIWVTSNPTDSLNSQFLHLSGELNYLRNPQLPTFRASPLIANEILANEETSITDIFMKMDSSDQEGEGWFVRNADTRLRMRLILNEPESYELKNVLGFLPGTDFDQASEMVVLLAEYDGLGEDPDGTLYPAANHNGSGVGMLLELARLWQQESLDPRRPVLFVAWGSGTQDFIGVEEFFGDPSNFRHLISANPNERIFPSIILHIDNVGAGQNTIHVSGGSPNTYLDILRETADELGISLVAPEDAPPFMQRESARRIPWMHFGWAQLESSSRDDIIDHLDTDRFTEFGQLLTLMMVKIVRETSY